MAENTAARRAALADELSDEDLFGADELSDDELFADDSSAPTLRKDEATGRDERKAAQALNWLDLGLDVGDEIVAAGAAADAFVRSGGDWNKASKAYDSEVEYARDLKNRYRAQPDTTLGDVVSTAGGLAVGAPLFGPVFRGAQIGARALSGGRAATKIGRGLQNTAAMGLTGGAAVEAAQFGDAEGDIGDRVQAVQSAGVLPAVAGVGLGMVAGPLGMGATKVAQKVGGAFRGAGGRGARYIAESLRRGGQTVDELAEAHAQAAKTGKPVALADVGAQEVRDAAGVAARGPGGRDAAQATLGPRQEGAVARVSDDVAQAAGGKPGTFTQTIDDITAARAEEARPLYQRALGSNKPVKSAKIVEITNRPSGKAAMQRGLKIAQDEGIPESELVIRDSAGNIVGYSAKALHYMKMALDDMIESAVRSGDNSAARAFTIMKNELLGEMDRAVPGYAEARKVFAGHSANKRAVEQGRQAVNKHPDEIRREMADMSAGEREMYRRGFAQRIIEQVEASGDYANAARRVIGNTAKRERLKAVLGDEEYNRLMQRLGLEDQMYGTWAQVHGNSATAQRTIAEQTFEASVGLMSQQTQTGVAASLAQGNVAPLVRAIGMSGIANLLRGIGPKARGEIARMLFSTNPSEVRQALQMIRKAYGDVLAAEGINRVGGGVVAGSVAANPKEAAVTTAATVGMGADALGQATAPYSPLW